MKMFIKLLRTIFSSLRCSYKHTCIIVLHLPCRPQIQRPGTGMPKSQSSNAVRKEYQLEISDDSNKENFQIPQLYQFESLDEWLQPVSLPKVK